MVHAASGSLNVLLFLLAVVAAASGSTDAPAATTVPVPPTVSAPSATTSDSPLAVAALPKNPAAGCASVHEAFAACRTNGAPDSTCCSQLQAVYGNSSSQAFGCLCLPAVLYKTMLAASAHDVQALEVLSSCQRQALIQGLLFDVQWAGHQASRCPALPLSEEPADLLSRMGEEPLLGGHWPKWGWTNLRQAGQFLVQYDQLESFTQHLLGKKLLDMSLLVFLALPVVFVVMHHAVLWPLSKTYRGLPIMQRLVTCQHAVYAAVFAVSLVPQTVMACRLLFGAWTGEILANRLWTALMAFTMSRCGLYVIESGVRAVKWSDILVAHHVIFLALLAQNVRSNNSALGTIGVVLDLFACHEAPLYVALVAYRLHAPMRMARGILQWACAWYIITRVLQTAILGYMIADLARLPAINREPAFIVTALMCAALTVIQAYTVNIYRGIDRKLVKALAGESALYNTVHKAAVDSVGSRKGSPSDSIRAYFVERGVDAVPQEVDALRLDRAVKRGHGDQSHAKGKQA